MNDTASLSYLTGKFQALVRDLAVESYYKTLHITPQHDGTPHIEVVGGTFEYVITERGSELERIRNLSADDVLYLLFEGITRHMAIDYELQHRKPGTDGRSIWFPYQECLMESMNASWGEKLGMEHRRILEKYP